MLRLQKPVVCLLAILILLAVTGPVLANEMNGTITQISAFENVIVVKDGNFKVFTFNVVANSNGRVNLEQVAPLSLKVGDRVTVTYDDNAGKLVIKEIVADR